MASKKRKFRQKLEHDALDDFDTLYDEYFEDEESGKDAFRMEWEDWEQSDRQLTARRRIERRRDRQRLYSQLDDFEEFGKGPF